MSTRPRRSRAAPMATTRSSSPRATSPAPCSRSSSSAACPVINKDGPGFSTVEMDTAGKAAEIAEDLALVTESRYMPPWPASDLSLEFEHDFSLTEDEIETIAKWADDGGGLDVEPDTELVADEPPFEDIERDQVVPMEEEYVGDLALKDDYRCQIHEIADPEGDGEWISGIAFEPDELDVVHHSISDEGSGRGPRGGSSARRRRRSSGLDVLRAGQPAGRRGAGHRRLGPRAAAPGLPRGRRPLPRARRLRRQPDPLPLRPRDPAGSVDAGVRHDQHRGAGGPGRADDLDHRPVLPHPGRGAVHARGGRPAVRPRRRARRHRREVRHRCHGSSPTR